MNIIRFQDLPNEYTYTSLGDPTLNQGVVYQKMVGVSPIKKFKKWEYFAKVVQALALTIFTLGIALAFQSVRSLWKDLWKEGLAKERKIICYVDYHSQPQKAFNRTFGTPFARALQDLKLGYSISGKIKEYGIQDADERLYLAKLAVENDRTFPTCILDYDLNEEGRAELVKRMITMSPIDVLLNFKKYQIASEQKRLEIFLEGISQYAGILAPYIKTFQLDKEDLRFEAAKAILKYDVWILGCSMNQFDIQNEERRIALARLAVANNPIDLSLTIGYYQITNEQVRVELARLAIQKAGKEIIESIQYGQNWHQRYQITQPEVVQELTRLMQNS